MGVSDTLAPQHSSPSRCLPLLNGFDFSSSRVALIEKGLFSKSGLEA